MTDHDKAVKIADKIRELLRLRSTLTAEKVLEKCCDSKELDWYYRAVCEPIR